MAASFPPLSLRPRPRLGIPTFAGSYIALPCSPSQLAVCPIPFDAMGGRLPPSQGPPRFNEQFLSPKSISVSAEAAAYGQSVNGAAILSRLDARCQPEIGGASEAGVRRVLRARCRSVC